MKKQRNMTQQQFVVWISFSAILLGILVTKIMLLIHPELNIQKDASTINNVYFPVMLVFLAFTVWKTRMPVNLNALKVQDKKHFLIEMRNAAFISAGLIAIMVIYRQILNTRDPVVAARPAFKLYLGIHARWFYPVSTILQELFIKGLMQDNFRSLSPDGNRHFTVLLNRIFFATLHMNYPLYYLVGAGLLCILTGYMYEHDRNIWGSSLIHFTVGFMPRVLGLK